MALDPGTRFGPYEVTGQIGAGGMGEVYRATDSKLGRDVAIKTLPEALASDKDRLARFEREAKLLASLSHPHIASIYSLDEHEGTLYLAMELIEGETLEEKLKPGAIPVEDALRLALQVAEALEAAHDKGVIHRDLKPANIMVTPDGIIKVLDFGLAKAFSNDPNEVSAAQSPALSVAMTQQGLVLGTAGYMSPEQASGQATDQRADIWAFGVVLYEMLTGLPLFSGESVPHILAAVLQNEPDWDRLPKNLHPRLAQLLERCLRKKPRVRYHAIADVRVDIEEILSDPAGTTSATVGLAEAAPRSAFRRFGLPAGLMAIAAVVAGYGSWNLKPEEVPEPRPINRFVHIPNSEQGLYNATGVLAVSPTGRHFAYNTAGGVYLRSLDETEGRLIPGIPNSEPRFRTPFFSADGLSLAANQGGELVRIAIMGGVPVFVANVDGQPGGFFGATWAADDTILYGRLEGIFRVPANGGEPELIIEAQDGEILADPVLLPGGDTLLFSKAEAADRRSTSRIFSHSFSTGEQKELIPRGMAPRYLPTGHLAYVLDNNLFGVAFDAESLTASSSQVPLVQGVNVSSNTLRADYGVSGDGTLIYLSSLEGAGATRRLAWVDRNGTGTAIGMPPCSCPDHEVALSPDGTQAAVTILDIERNESDIWIWSFATETQTRLTFEVGNQLRPVWTADSERIFYSSGGEGILVRAADGTGTAEMLFAESSAEAEPWALDADGNVLFEMNDDIYVLNVAEDGEAEPLIASEFEEGMPALSPDGDFIAYVSVENGMPEILVRPYPNVAAGRWQVSSNGGIRPEWAADGSRLWFVVPRTGDFMQAEVETEPSFSRQTPEALFSLDSIRGFSASADGEQFLSIVGTGGVTLAQDNEGNEGLVIIVQNWLEEVKRLVPTD